MSAKLRILEHILAYPGTYELPLRTMYTFNSNPHVSPTNGARRQGPASGESNRATPPSPTFNQHDLKSSLLAEMAQAPSNTTSLPPSFITSYARRCFTPELSKVDFPQSLTCLDYLRDLEMRRRREVKAAVNRLGAKRENVEKVEDDLAERYPGAYEWWQDLEAREGKVLALYGQLYVGLRRWVSDLRPETSTNSDKIADTYQ